MKSIIVTDLIAMLVFYGVFILAYASNVVFSIYQNMELLNQQFDKKKFFQGILKCLVFVLGSLLLVLAIDFATYVFNRYGIIGEGIDTVVTVVMLLATIGTAAIKYIKEAYDTFSAILNGVKE